MGYIRRADDIFAAQMGDTLLMMSVEQGRYFGLSGVAPRIWELIGEPTTEAVLTARLLEEYDIDRSSCSEQVTRFLGDLRTRGLLVDLP